MTNKMAKLSLADKMRIQTLREQGLGARAIRNTYPEKRWVLSTISKICKRVDSCGSAVERKVGSGRPKTARIAENIEKVKELLCSQEDQPCTGQSTRQVARQLQISQGSVRNIAKNDLKMNSFKRVGVQMLSEANKVKRLTRSKALLKRLTAAKCRRVFFTDEKVFYIDPPVNSQNNRVWGLMLDSYNKLNPKPTSRSELKNALQNIWDALPHTPIQKAIRSFRKRLQLCVRVEGGHFEHLLK